MADVPEQPVQCQQAPHGQCATRRGLLLGVGLAGVGVVLAGCSTEAVPYGANEQGQVPGAQSQPSTAGGATAAMGGTAPGGGSTSAAGGVTGTVLGAASQIPVGGGVIFTAEKVVVTQPAKGEYKAFSAICTHVGCLCNVVANGTINCPCHGSKFKITDGSLVTGPGSGPLPGRTIAVTDGKILLQ
jgi:nitrite reductase/ring-hydroxylating ferredoxin subunit